MDKHFWVAAYDIADGRRLRRVANVMTRFGTRVQKSVFDCWLDEQELRQLREELATIMEQGKDRVRFYKVCRRCREQSTALCTTEFIGLDIFYIV